MHALLPSVVKDRRSVHQFPIGTSPLPAERGIGLEPKPRKSLYKIKNPARAPGESVQLNGCARSSLSFYPVFVTNLTSCEKADPVRQQTPQRIRVLPTSGESIRLSNNVKSLSKNFMASICEFQRALWKLRKSRYFCRNCSRPRRQVPLCPSAPWDSGFRQKISLYCLCIARRFQ